MNIFNEIAEISDMPAEFTVIIKIIAILSFMLGVLECFAGFKTVKIMMAMWGFVFGVLICIVLCFASEIYQSGTPVVIIISAVGGIILAVLAFKLYLAGIFILVSLMTYISFYLVILNQPVSILFALAAGVAAIILVKPMVIVSTSFSGANLILSAVYMIFLVTENYLLLHYTLLICIACCGIAVQFKTTSKSCNSALISFGKKKTSEDKMSFSERRYPGMQRAYRNFCINCGYELSGTDGKCPYCGFEIKD